MKPLFDPVTGKRIPLAVAYEAERARAAFFYKWARHLIAENDHLERALRTLLARGRRAA
jgi:hypothetical protein